MTAVPDEGWLVAHPPPRRARLFALPLTTDGYTLDDWLKLPETGERIELIDGCFVVSPLPSYGHALVASRLVRILDDARPQDYEVVGAGNLKVGEDGLIPDVVLGRAKAILEGPVALPASDAVCVAEVVSPGKVSRDRDYTIKPPKYAAAGIAVFIRVDLEGDDAPRVEVFNLSGEGYELVAEGKAGNVLSLDQPFPLSFDPAVLTGRRSTTQG
ncbi:Uma2 family endonuclease [Nonomuraea angiospora]|uniref:Uma2 family endonuclease n=1 Tax=Nonomuraea angiospora TaxID=46172 RepID=A0ABR9ML26_9ACTN|nr:Uma2 family endonuclease [Nonomuraea angiospora]MBE1593203.1 Uma2 family endonuclease [Nonomuraea angiospora]